MALYESKAQDPKIIRAEIAILQAKRAALLAGKRIDKLRLETIDQMIAARTRQVEPSP